MEKGFVSRLLGQASRVATREQVSSREDLSRKFEQVNHAKQPVGEEDVPTSATSMAVLDNLVRKLVLPSGQDSTEETVDICKQAIEQNLHSTSSSSIEARKRAWDALEHLAVREVNTGPLVTHGIPSLCKHAIETENDEEARLKALTTLRELALHSQAQVPLVGRGIVQVCTQVIEQEDSSEDARALCLETLHNLSLNPTNQVVMVDLGVLELCKQVVEMKRSLVVEPLDDDQDAKTHLDELYEALSIMEKLASNQVNSAKLLGCGVVELCMDLIQDHQCTSTVSFKSWRILLHLTCNDGNLLEMLEKGVAKICPLAIDQDSCVASRVLALAIAQNLCFPSEYKAFMANEMGMVKRCVNVVMTDTSKARTFALGVLQNLTDCTVNASSMLDTGVVQACALAIQQRGSHATRVNALKTLQNLAWPKENKMRMVEMGVDNICIQAAELNAGEARTKALATLQNLCLDKETPKVMLSHRLIKLCNNVVLKHQGTEASVIAVAILHVLASVEENVEQMIDFGVVELCSTVLMETSKSIDQWHNGSCHGYSIEGYALLTLLTLAQNPETRPELRQRNVLKIFLDVHKFYRHSQEAKPSPSPQNLKDQSFRLLSTLGILLLGTDKEISETCNERDLEDLINLFDLVVDRRNVELTLDLSWRPSQLIEPLLTMLTTSRFSTTTSLKKQSIPLILKYLAVTKNGVPVTNPLQFIHDELIDQFDQNQLGQLEALIANFRANEQQAICK